MLTRGRTRSVTAGDLVPAPRSGSVTGGPPVDTVRPSVGSWPAVTGWPKGRAGMKLPIVYVRGFAGSTSGINEAVDDPFYGFTPGAPQVRVGGAGEPHFYQFESPMLRLLVDRD